MRDGITFPSWVPALVADWAMVLHQQAVDRGHLDEAAMIVRVTSDLRMKKFWAYLQSKRRDPEDRHIRTHEYKHAAPDADPNGPYPSNQFPTRQEWRQQAAFERIYSEVIRWGGLPLRLPLSEFRLYAKEAASLRAKAEAEAKLEAGTDRRVNRCRSQHAKLARAYIRAAEAADALAVASSADAKELAPALVTVGIAEALLQNFGDRMYGQAATIASVVLESTVTAAEAREYCRGVWGYLEKKPA